MFFRVKPSGKRRYLQIVENTRKGRRTIQRVRATLGRIEDLEADGKLDSLLRSGARFSETAMPDLGPRGRLHREQRQHADRCADAVRPSLATKRLPPRH